jgi:hypothetical protein
LRQPEEAGWLDALRMAARESAPASWAVKACYRLEVEDEKGSWPRLLVDHEARRAENGAGLVQLKNELREKELPHFSWNFGSKQFQIWFKCLKKLKFESKVLNSNQSGLNSNQ